MDNTITILDFGGQYAHLITNRIRRIGVHAIIKPHDTPADELKNCSGIILSGGPQSVNAPNALLADPKIFELGIPILGICYGHQVTNKMLGGTVSPGKTKEYGKTTLYIDRPVGIFKDIFTSHPNSPNSPNSPSPSLTVWMSHWDEVTEIPVDFEVLAHTEINDFAAVGNLKKHIYGIQFHPEVTHTEQGMQILKNFVDLTGAEKNWSTKNYLEQIKQEILDQTNKPSTLNSQPSTLNPQPSTRNVFMMVSGGVDSMVAFTLLNQVLGEDQVYGMLVDTGFMRKGEIEEVQAALSELGFHNLHVDDAKDDFYSALKGISEPEEKRQIIGKKFIERQAEAVHKLKLNPDHWLFGQGTIYPDTIESGGTDKADKIKTHHNRVPEIVEMEAKGLIIEPLRDLYKDEVRQLGEQIGLPHHLVWRHPFPGPGLAIRILCSPPNPLTPLKGGTPTQTTNSLISDNGVSLSPPFKGAGGWLEEEQNINAYLKEHQLTGKILPIQSVGVQGDARTYRHPLAIFPTANKSWSDYWKKEELQEISTELTNRFESINRVLFTLNSDPVTSAEIIPDRYLTPNRVQKLQEADFIVMNELNSFDEEEKVIWQCPTVLLPLSINNAKSECFVLRPVSSIDAMTADFALIPEKNLNNILVQLKNLKPSAILYDLTNKPPGTIEWE